jgi:hypothetical protein
MRRGCSVQPREEVHHVLRDLDRLRAHALGALAGDVAQVLLSRMVSALTNR